MAPRFIRVIRRILLACGVMMIALGSAAASPAISFADKLPDIPRAMIDAAGETGDPQKVLAVTEAASAVFPDHGAVIDAYGQAIAAALTPVETVDEASADNPDKGVAGLFSLQPWEGKITGSAARASGNSRNTAYGLAFDGARVAGKFTHNLSGGIDIATSGIAGTNESELTQKRWGLTYQLDYALNDRFYSYARFSYDEDQFSGFDYRLFGGAGIGYFLYKTEPFTWQLETGPGYRYSLIDDNSEIDSQFALYGSSEIDWIIREGVVFEQDFDATWTSATSTFSALTALSTGVTKTISVGLSYLYRYETNPPAGRVNADTLLRAAINYGF